MAVEQGWQRGFAFVELSATEIEELIHPYAAGARVLEATLLTGGLRNTNYRVQLSSRAEPVVLRLYSADPSACRRETALSRLVEANVPVPHVLHAEPSAEPPWALVTWAEGVRFDEFMLTATEAEVDQAACSAGQVLAAIHAYQFSRPGFFGPDLDIAAPHGPESGWSTMLTEWLLHGRSGSRLGPDITARLLHFIADNASRMDAIGGQTSLLHADYKPWNLLVKNNAISAVLDWEFAFSGAPSNDIGIFLRYSATQPPAYRTGFLCKSVIWTQRKIRARPILLKRLTSPRMNTRGARPIRGSATSITTLLTVSLMSAARPVSPLTLRQRRCECNLPSRHGQAQARW